jgi:prepilin-type N-terminal cleavage/methylation domain-containing protein
MRRVLHPTRSTPRTALRAGFTLIELCMATVMLGVLAGTAAPRVAAQLARARVAQAAAVTAADLERAFSLAQRSRRSVAVTFNAAARSYNVTTSDQATTFISRTLASGDYAVAQLTPSVATLQIAPNGLASGVPAGESLTVVVSSGGYSRSVTATRAGRVRITAVTAAAGT